MSKFGTFAAYWALTDLISNAAWRAFVLRRLNEQERDILKQQDSAEVFTN